MIPLIKNLFLAQSKRLVKFLPVKLLAKITLVERATTIRETEIIYGAIPTPLVSTLSLSVFFSLSGALTIFALSEFTETRDNC